MLEIKNVYRTYKPKKGIPVKALDGVSLSFADTGLVFILGKSGSGKSTLLNVIGGLDTADSGEFSIKGKSSKDFSQADFDSYRNTFIGFIFQEYNILNEFTVGQNIALAMKLQGKKVDDKSLNEILEEVDLVGYGNRKPNELSGGQKQRVAIARALIKEPEIIMADEPTGALDSNTGKQVFDTLKKLSKSKLVIVVSHDREFAEYYGDRVIELADGKIISDISKETAESRKESEGLSVVDDKILHIRKGYKLTAEDMKKIQQYLDNSESDTIISLDERSNESFCQIARIDKDGNQEVFRDTDNGVLSESNKKYDGSSKFIRSKLPASHAFKIGASSLKTKPFRLFMTIFLCLISFAMFGLADTIGSYNARKTTVNSILDSNYDSAVLGAKVLNGDYYSSVGASAKDLERVKEMTGMEFTGVAKCDSSFSTYEPNKLRGNNYSMYYLSRLVGYLPASEEDFATFGFGQMQGKMPAADDEIVITKYIYEQYALAGLTYYDNDNNEQINIKSSDIESEEQFLKFNPIMEIRSNGFGESKIWKIVGIVDTKADESKRFESLKPTDSASTENLMSMLLTQECQQYFTYGYHSLGYVSKNTYNAIVDSIINPPNASIGKSASGYMYFQNDNNDYSYFSLYFDAVAGDEALSELEILWVDNNARENLADNEFIVNVDRCSNIFAYNGSDRVEVEEIEINFNKSYFGGILSFNISKLSDLHPNMWTSRSIAIWEAAQALTKNQTGAFRAFIQSIGEEYGDRAMNYYVQRLKDYIVYSWDSASEIEFDSSNLAYDFANMSDEELRCLYAGYLNCYEVGVEAEVDGQYEYVYINGGDRQNVLGLDCGMVVRDYNSQKIYYSELLKAVNYSFEIDSANYMLTEDNNYKNIKDVKIVGFYIAKRTVDENGYWTDYSGSEVVINNALYKALENVEPAVYTFFIAPMPKDRAQIEKLVDIHYDETGERGFSMQNGATFMLGMVDSMLEVLGQVFLYIGIGLAVFSMLLMSNYIAVSISYKKREIGILRAVGAKSSDVFSIFFSESLIIALINFFLSMVVCGVGCMLLNNMLRSEYGLQITLLNFGFRQIALMLLISVAVALVSSFLPVYRLSRKKPIETIRTA